LITSSNLTGNCTGSSLGFAPLRMRSALSIRMLQNYADMTKVEQRRIIPKRP
jgi:hypothetical protein